jgi:hypothetical protein
MSGKSAINATVRSGIRSVFGYCVHARVKSWSPFEMQPNPLDPWVIDTLEELSKEAPFGNGRVMLGLAFDLWYYPKEVIVPLFERIKKMELKIWTVHYASLAALGMSLVNLRGSSWPCNWQGCSRPSF